MSIFILVVLLNIDLLLFYRTPVLDLCATDHLINCLYLFCDVVYGVTICGDFNLPNINWVNGFDLSCLHPLEGRLASFVGDNGMSQLVHEPTRLTHILDPTSC